MHFIHNGWIDVLDDSVLNFKWLACGFDSRQIHYCIVIVWLFTLYTYIIRHYNPSVSLASHTTQVVCVNFISEWRDLEFRLRTTDFWETYSWQVYLFSEFLAENLLRGNCRRNVLFIFRFDAWPWGYEPGLYL